MVPYRKNKSLKEQKGYMIPQSELLNYDIFPLFYSSEVKLLADKLLKIPNQLSEYSDIFRGISLGSKNSLIQKDNFEGSAVCYRGDSIKKFGIKYPLFIDLSKIKNGDKRKVERLQKRKVILQNLFSREGGIFASISSEKEVNLDTVTNIVPKDNLDPEIILGILSSRLANFFIIHVTFLNSNFTMHADKAYIGKLPIVLPEPSQKERIKRIVQELNEIEDKYSSDFIRVYNKLNTEIYKLYRLDGNEIKVLEDSLKGVMSKKQNG
jgi:predicted metallopeptidase